MIYIFSVPMPFKKNRQKSGATNTSTNSSTTTTTTQPPPPPPSYSEATHKPKRPPSQPRPSTAVARNGAVCVEMISTPVLQDSTNKQSENSPYIGKQAKSLAFKKFLNREKEDSPKTSPKPLPKPPIKRNDSDTTKQNASVVKKDSFNREISDPVLISTTDRRSKAFVKDFKVDANANGDDNGISITANPPQLPTNSPNSIVTRKSSSDRVPPRPTSMPPAPRRERSRKQENRKSALSPPRPPNPPQPPPHLPPPHALKPSEAQQQFGRAGETTRLNLNPNLFKPRKEEEDHATDSPRVFFDRSKVHGDSKKKSASPYTQTQYPQLGQKLSTSNSKANNKSGPSTNSVKDIFELKKVSKPPGVHNMSGDSTKNGRYVPSQRPTATKPVPHSRDIKPKTSVNKPSDVHAALNRQGVPSKPSDLVSKGRKPLPKQSSSASVTSETSRKPLPKQSSSASITSETTGDVPVSSGVAAISAMFDDMDVGQSLKMSDHDSSPESGASFSRKPNSINSGDSEDRPRPPPKPGSGKGTGKLRSVNV